ncbi:MAG: right-handed parallel beta-helix repeat-containing protein [Sedimentisphaerales bacterium]|nr:right-handed parallel beta-helix repeat-containing protein [Sedimentisphaerales bacterium]
MKWVCFLAVVLTGIAAAQSITVSDSAQLQSALRKAEAGTTILLQPGRYRGSLYTEGQAGTAENPIVITGADPTDKPVFSGGGQALHLADCRYVTLRNLVVKGFPSNGINIDDGGSFDTPAHHIIVEDVTILETGPKGNHDALKMSGVDHFVVRRCRFIGWGGSGIDMVGCHYGVVEDCLFEGKEGFSQSNAVQLKGGTTNILVQTSLFRHCGHRAINLGGSTGLEFFRPRVADFEAKEIEIAGNRFVDSMTPLAWVTANGGWVHHNTIVRPDKWTLRILQETKDTRFKPCYGGVFENNLVAFDSRVDIFVNIGPGTAPETFRFRRNAWCDLEGRRKPVLPTPEEDGIYSVPIDAEESDLQAGQVRFKDSTHTNFGADNYERKTMKWQ